jgi:predicted DNA-binding protein
LFTIRPAFYFDIMKQYPTFKFRISPGLKTRLEKLSQKTGLSISRLIKDAIKKHYPEA